MIHVEKSALNSPLVKILESEGRSYAIIDSADEVEDEKSELIIVSRNDSYCHPCPATQIYRCCNYHVTDVMEGCPFDCSYCILQSYLDHKNIRISADINEITNSIRALADENNRLRLGTGELSDSLALDHIFPFSTIIAPIINAQDAIQFEFKTKSANIANLLNLNPRNIVVSWSLNPSNIVSAYEKGAAPVGSRIDAAVKCAEAGYKVAFHFDPVIYYDGYEADYAALINLLTEKVPEQSVEYISLSTLRAPAKLMETMRGRNPAPRFLTGDFITGLDGKFRYFKPLREAILSAIYGSLRKRWKQAFIYFCMEHSSVWKKITGLDPGQRHEFESLFPYWS